VIGAVLAELIERGLILRRIAATVDRGGLLGDAQVAIGSGRPGIVACGTAR
jgi:hypothetical protein